MRSEGMFETDVDQEDRDIFFAEKVVSVLAGRNKTAQSMGNNTLPVPQDWSVSQVAIHSVARNKVGDMINIVDFDCPRAISKLDSYNDELAVFVAAFADWGNVM
jgi:hypothetical protein